MTHPPQGEGTYGYLALMQLLASAQLDARLRPSHRQALVVMASFAGADGGLCVALPTLADRLGISRQAAQKAMHAAEDCGYVTAVRRPRATGAEGAKVYQLNLDLAGAVACPFRSPGELKELRERRAEPCPKRTKADSARARNLTNCHLSSSIARGGQPSEVAGAGNPQRLRGAQPPEVAHKKPPEETINEETSARPAGAVIGNELSRGTTACQQGERRRWQHHLPLPITGGAAQAPPGQRVAAAVEVHNQERRAEAGGRIMQQWFRLGGDELLDYLGDGFDHETGVFERAITAELRQRGNGVKYIAGAVARATSGSISVAHIMGGRDRRRSA